MTYLVWLGSRSAPSSSPTATATEAPLKISASSQHTATPNFPTSAHDPGGAALAAIGTDPRTTGHHRLLTAAPAPVPGPSRCAQSKSHVALGCHLRCCSSSSQVWAAYLCFDNPLPESGSGVSLGRPLQETSTDAQIRSCLTPQCWRRSSLSVLVRARPSWAPCPAPTQRCPQPGS